MFSIVVDHGDGWSETPFKFNNPVRALRQALAIMERKGKPAKVVNSAELERGPNERTRS